MLTKKQLRIRSQAKPHKWKSVIEREEQEKHRAIGWLRDDYFSRHRCLDILQQCADSIVEGKFLEACALYGRFAEWESKRLFIKGNNMRMSQGNADYARLNLSDYRDPNEREQCEYERICTHLQRHNATLGALIAACPAGREPGTVQVDSELAQRYQWFRNVCALFFEKAETQRG